MSRQFIAPPTQAHLRRVLFAIELLDAVTLARVSQGVEVVAEGLHGKPRVSAGGIFVWLEEDFGRLRKVTIEPGLLPYQRVELTPAEVQQNGLKTVELAPRVDFVFVPGITGIRGTLIENRVFPEPVRDAEIHLRWLDVNGAWRDAPTISRTDTKGGDFAVVLRLAPSDVPLLDVDGVLTTRLRVRRDGRERESSDLKLPPGRVADPSTFPQAPNTLVFAWDELKQ